MIPPKRRHVTPGRPPVGRMRGMRGNLARAVQTLRPRVLFKLVAVMYCMLWVMIVISVLQPAPETERDNVSPHTASAASTRAMNSPSNARPVHARTTLKVCLDQRRLPVPWPRNQSFWNSTVSPLPYLSHPYNLTQLKPGLSLSVPEGSLWFNQKFANADIWNLSSNDRLLQQLAHMRSLPLKSPDILQKPPKIILNLISTLDAHDMLKKSGCPVYNCVISANRSVINDAAAVVFSTAHAPHHEKPPGQVWIYHQLESPQYTGTFPHSAKEQVNWTATYRQDSTIVTPYDQFVPYDPHIKVLQQHWDYAANKTKMVAWFVSNCVTCNGRMAYAKALSKYVSVDIYGRCGRNRCGMDRNEECLQKLRDKYKFYLAFENSNCRNYITEKFFMNALKNDVIPIVMGAHPDDYRQVAPPHSYIHVEDFPTPQALAEYLAYLDRNHTAYNEYFRWKGTGTFINTHFMCRVCAMLHERPPDQHSWIPDINEWWRGPGVCQSGFQ